MTQPSWPAVASGGGGVVLALHNLADGPRAVALDLSPDGATHLVELLGDRQRIPVHTHVLRLTPDGYGYRWFRLHETQE